MIRILAGIVFLISCMAAPSALAEKAPIYTSAFNNMGAGGYDVVTFFGEDGPSKGSKAFIVQHQGADFLFSSQENLNKFQEMPEVYLPQYGGYCAWAMADGKFAKGDPAYWSIVDGKLYLNYNASIKQKWETDISHFIKSADREWLNLLDK